MLNMSTLSKNDQVRGLYHDGHKPWWPQQWRPQTITAPKKVHDGHTEDYDGQTITATNDDGPKKVHDGHTEDYNGQTITATNNDGQIHDGHKR